MGEFARGIGALEQLLGIEIAADQVNELFVDFLRQMGPVMGREHFYMGSDKDHDEAWYEAANVSKPLMPIDEAGRLRLIRTASMIISIGSPTLQLMAGDVYGDQYVSFAMC